MGVWGWSHHLPVTQRMWCLITCGDIWRKRTVLNTVTAQGSALWTGLLEALSPVFQQWFFSQLAPFSESHLLPAPSQPVLTGSHRIQKWTLAVNCTDDTWSRPEIIPSQLFCLLSQAWSWSLWCPSVAAASRCCQSVPAAALSILRSYSVSICSASCAAL